MKIILILMVITLFCTGCASTSFKETNLQKNISAKEYNSFRQQFMPRPTSIYLEEHSNEKSLIALYFDSYSTKTRKFVFSKDKANSYIGLINKFIKWEKLAQKNQDMFTKDIGSVDSWSYPLGMSMLLTFHSGNEDSHYLKVSLCVPSLCENDYSAYLDLNNAKKLSKLLSEFAKGEIKGKDIDSIYN